MRRVLLVVGLTAALAAAGAPTARAFHLDYRCSPGAADCGGWHRTPVTLQWSWDGGILSCPARQTIATDGQNAVTCILTGTDGSATRTARIAIDRTPPVVTGATVSRLPDHGGWYRAPVQVRFAGSDPGPGSGLLSCSTVTYAGPGSDPVNVMGTCTDVAGNVSVPFPFPLRYDATPPALLPPRTAAGDRIVRVRWAAPPDATSLALLRRPGRHGARTSVVHRGRGGLFVDRHVRNGRHYEYTLRARDAAGNVGTSTTTAVPGRRLIAPIGGTVVSAPPRLSWTAARGARYYNVQLYRRGHKLLSAWPHRPQLHLRASWRYAGRRHHLKAGRYRWYVWPGRGRPSQRRFGPLIGRAEFVVRRG